MRGEYGGCRLGQNWSWELPPRARRIHVFLASPEAGNGTTSACAENTVLSISHQGRAWNYLRVRGEYGKQFKQTAQAMELPPRARRIHQKIRSHVQYAGTTSACAENTTASDCAMTPRGNYLRVRGEYIKSLSTPAVPRELPPRARRIRRVTLVFPATLGTTSACAENTISGVWGFPKRGNYLRVRGEYPK